MLTACRLSFLGGDEGGQRSQPLLAALEQIPSGQSVGQFLQTRRVIALQEGVGALLEVDALFPPPLCQPVVRTPARKMDIVVHISDGNQDAGRLPCFQDGHPWVGLGVLEVWLHKLVSPALVIAALWGLHNRSTPFRGSVLHPGLKPIGDFRQVRLVTLVPSR